MLGGNRTGDLRHNAATRKSVVSFILGQMVIGQSQVTHYILFNSLNRHAHQRRFPKPMSQLGSKESLTKTLETLKSNGNVRLLASKS